MSRQPQGQLPAGSGSSNLDSGILDLPLRTPSPWGKTGALPFVCPLPAIPSAPAAVRPQICPHRGTKMKPGQALQSTKKARTPSPRSMCNGSVSVTQLPVYILGKQQRMGQVLGPATPWATQRSSWSWPGPCCSSRLESRSAHGRPLSHCLCTHSKQN